MSTDREKRARFDTLARSLATDLFRYSLWLCGQEALARDLVQETFLRAWRALDSLKDDRAAKSWLITILRREYARTFERIRPQFTDVDAVPLPDADTLGPEERAERSLLRRGMQELAPRYRDPLLLQVVVGLSCKEIAQELGISKSAVMTQLFRAREQLKSRLAEDGITGKVHELG